MRITWTTPIDLTPAYAEIIRRDGVPLVNDDALPAPSRLELSRQELLDKAGRLATGSVTDVDDELKHRVRPLREQWDARGPGLLRSLEAVTAADCSPEQATIALVLPITGGHGVPLANHDAVLFEALLANPNPQLPEVVRLAWLLARLRSDAGHAAALVPAVLTAAEEVELAAASKATIAEALFVWRIVGDAQQAAVRAEQLWRWWNDYRAKPAPWAEALAVAPAG